MLNEISRLFRPPVFPADEDKTRRAKYANAMGIALLVVALLYEVTLRAFLDYTAFSILDIMVLGLATVCAVALVLLRKGYVGPAAILLVVMTWLVSNSISAAGFGIKDSSYVINFAIVLMAGLLVGWQAALMTTMISILAGFGLAYAETNGWITVEPYPVTTFAQDMAFVFGLNAVLMYLLISGLEGALQKSRQNLQELEAANISLNQTQIELEKRSNDLQSANIQLETRSRKLRTIAEITRTATALRSFDELLRTITQIIANELGYDLVAIFLLDEERQYAILRSGNTEHSIRMVEQGFRLPIGQLGLVGSVAQSGKPTVSLGEAIDRQPYAASQGNEMQSQLVLPLKFGAEIIGVMDSQSSRANEFTEDDVSTLSILADQVGISLQNALVYEESQRALQEAHAQSRQASRRAWHEFEEMIKTRGYRYDGIKSEPLRDAPKPERENGTMVIPVQLRGQTIGRLKLSAPDHRREWTEDELMMVQATAERVALALESARLLDEAQRRASREAFLSEVASKLSTSFQIDSILRDTVQELGQNLANSTVTFQLVPPEQHVPDRQGRGEGMVE
jgi:GAF domain-containing protein